MKHLTKIFGVLVLLVFISSCSKDNSNLVSDEAESNATAIQQETTDSSFYTESVNYTTHANSLPASQRCGSSNGGSNTLDLCNNLYNVGNIQSNTYWGILDNGPGSIDYELEQLFNYSFDFSYTYIRPNGPPTTIEYGEVWFQESPSFNLDTFEYDIYYYTDSNNITVARSNELRQHFACAIDAYRDANLPGALISQVNFFGDVLLCTDGNDRYIKANFRMAIHGGGGKG